MRRVGCGLELANQAGAGEQQAFAFAVEFLLGIRHWPMGGFGLIAHFGLLLFYGLTFTPACHFGTILRFANGFDKKLAKAIPDK